MAGPWIEARDALEILRDRYVICERLFAGLIESRARLFTRDAERIENVNVPRELWWARGYPALEQNWDAGDFSTWLKETTHLSAFGVQLELSGVLAAVPPEHRGTVAARFSVAGNSDWVSADHAMSLIAPAALRPARHAESRLIGAARLGFVGARAVEALAANHGFKDWSWSEREWEVPAWFWEQYTASESSSRDFEQNMVRGRGRGPLGPYMQLNGLYFVRADLERQFGLSQSEPSNAGLAIAEAQPDDQPKNKGGRPPVAFADELMCAIWALIYQGDLQPRRQSDVEKAMLDWAVAQGKSLSETVAREKARKVFAAYSNEVGNPSPR